MSVLVSLNEGAACPICDRGTLHIISPGVWDCSRCTSQFFVEGDEGARSLNVRDKPVKPWRYVPQVSRPWNPALREVWDAMTPYERQRSFLIDVAICLTAILLIWWIA